MYLVEPTDKNCDQIINDCRANLYDYVLLSFTKPINAKMMDYLASGLVKVNQAHRIVRVTQEFFGGFQVIAPDFFVIPGGKANFGLLKPNPRQKRENDRVIIANAVNHIATGLFCLF